jgi:pyrroline-5-carboxylate reductase
MPGFPRTLHHIDGSDLGVVGAGRLGGALIRGLLHAGFPRKRLLVSHGASAETRARLAEEGLSGQSVATTALVARSRIILLVVRPQDVSGLERDATPHNPLVISFAAAVPISRLPWTSGPGTAVRVLTSAPETIERGTGIAGVTPPGNPVVEELLEALGLPAVPIDNEDELHAFTSAGVCLPMAFAFLRGQGRTPDDAEVRAFAARHALPHLDEILRWVYAAEPQFGTEAERRDFISRGTTPGGVTEAILKPLAAGGSLLDALEAGVRRSRELGRD